MSTKDEIWHLMFDFGQDCSLLCPNLREKTNWMEFSKGRCVLSLSLRIGQWQPHAEDRGCLDTSPSQPIVTCNSSVSLLDTDLGHQTPFPKFGLLSMLYLAYLGRRDLDSLPWHHFPGLPSTWNAFSTYLLSCLLAHVKRKLLLEAATVAIRKCDLPLL